MIKITSHLIIILMFFGLFQKTCAGENDEANLTCSCQKIVRIMEGYERSSHLSDAVITGAITIDDCYEVEKEDIVEMILNDPAGINREWSQRWLQHGAMFSVSEFEPLVRNMEKGINHFLTHKPTKEEVKCYEDFLTLLRQEVINKQCPYRQLCLSAFLFALLADCHYKIPKSELIIHHSLSHTVHFNWIYAYAYVERIIKGQGCEDAILSEMIKDEKVMAVGELLKTYIEVINHNDVFIFPTYMPLDFNFFNRTVPYGIYPGSLINKPLIVADGFIMSVFLFYCNHDVNYHAKSMMIESCYDDCGNYRKGAYIHAVNGEVEAWREDMIAILQQCQGCLSETEGGGLECFFLLFSTRSV